MHTQGHYFACQVPLCGWQVSGHCYWVNLVISTKSSSKRLENQFRREDLEYFRLWWEPSSSLCLYTGRSAAQIILSWHLYFVLSWPKNSRISCGKSEWILWPTQYLSIDLNLQNNLQRIPIYSTASISITCKETLQDTCFIWYIIFSVCVKVNIAIILYNQ